MPEISHSSDSLKHLLHSVLKPNPELRSLRAFIDLSHKMAVSYLRVKTSSGRFDLKRTGMSAEDFAFDCIADLFRRDFEGRFPELVQYFGPMESLMDAEDAFIENHYRRLVFSAVNHRIFRTFREIDPTLAKIIRNIKLHVKDHLRLVLTSYIGESVLVLRDDSGTTRHLPRIAPELFGLDMLDRAGTSRAVRSMLDAVAAALSELQGYRRMISLLETAELFRSLYVSDAQGDASYMVEPDISEEELHRFIAAVVRQMNEYAKGSYAEKGKLNNNECTKLVATVHDILVAEYIGLDGNASSYFDFLRQHVPDLSKDEYKRRFRTILEYLAKLAKEEMRLRLRREFEYPRSA